MIVRLSRGVVFFIIYLIIIGTSVSQGIPDSTFNTLLRTENGGWVAGDATYSIYLPDGRTLWLFGDSFIGTVNSDSSLASGAKMIRNCALIQEGDIISALYQGTFSNPSNFIQTPTPDSTWFWPEHGIIEDNDLKIIFSEFGTNDGAPGWNFEYRNAYVATFSYPEIELMSLEPLPYYEQNGVMYGDRLLNDGDYTYIYGRKEENPTNNIPIVHLARTSIGDIMGNWEFFDGNYWLDDPTVTKKLTDHPVSQQFGVFKHMDKYVLITQEIWLGAKVYSLVANQPEGPYSNLTVLYETPRPFPDMLTYNSYSHPQFNENNELLISYNSNGDFWEIFNNIELYRPTFFRVPYIIIHPSFLPTSIDETIDGNANVVCYPNPAQTTITFKLGTQNSGSTTVDIFNLFGGLVKTVIVNNSKQKELKIEIPIDDLPTGLYIYKVVDKTGKFIHN